MDSAWKEILRGSEKKFGRAAILIAFAVVSLVIAFVLFKFLNSSGIMSIVFPNEQGKADLGGSIVGFLLTLWLLIRSLDNDGEIELVLKGRVCDANGLPVNGAKVFAATAKHSEITNESGYFSIEVKPQKEWTVTATHEQQTENIIIKSNSCNDFIEVKFSEKK
jgi:hypothetical protein